jgi:riboflavin biosynthesis pyrimidine reductase
VARRTLATICVKVATRFDGFVERKTREAESARIYQLLTEGEGVAAAPLATIGNDWTRALYDGGFHLPDSPQAVPSINLVFVQSSDGNTGAANPGTLGGGPTDLHLIYEGVSRVAADAVLAGAASVGKDAFFSVWHPELVALRRALGLTRHPAQVVVSADGRIDVDRALLFNVPDVSVFVLAGAQCRERCAAGFALRPWITLLPLEPGGLIIALSRLRIEHGINRISAIGGRRTASSLIDANVVQDLCLTTSAHAGGESNTPFYVGHCRPALDLIVRKVSTDPGHPFVFEHSAFQTGITPAARR